MLAWALFAGDENLQTVIVARQVIAERPSYPQIYLCMALALVGMGDFPRARDAFEEARALAPGFVQSRLDAVWFSNCPKFLARANRFVRIAAGLDSA